MACASLALAVLGVYWVVVGHGAISYDDPVYVTENPHLAEGLSWGGVLWAFTTFRAVHWHPLTWLSLMLDVELFGSALWGHHLVNLILHAANAGLLFLVLGRMTGRAGRSWIVAALFSLHPLAVEPVAWLTGRKDLLAGLFCFLALGAYLRYARRPSALRYAAVAFLFALGLMAKPTVLPLPLILLLLDVWPLGRLRLPLGGDGGRSLGRLVLEKVPLLLLAVADAAVTVAATSGGGALRGLDAYPLPIRLANVPVSYVGYLGKLFWPTGLGVFYPHPGSTLLASWQPYVCTAGLVGLTWWIVRSAHSRPCLPVGWLWFLTMLVPVIGIVQAGDQAMADRFLYLPGIGIYLAVVWGAAEALRRAPGLRPAAMTGAGAVLVLCAALSHAQARQWRDDETLFSHMVRAMPDNWFAHLHLGRALFARGEYEAAIAHFREADGLNPGHAHHRFNLASALQEAGRLEEALVAYREVAQMAPGDLEALFRAALLASRLGRVEEAIGIYEEVLQASPGHFAARYNLGTLLAREGRLPEAAGHLEEASRERPDSAAARFNLGVVLAGLGRRDRAVQAFREALRLDPDLTEAREKLRLLAAGGDSPPPEEPTR